MLSVDLLFYTCWIDHREGDSVAGNRHIDFDHVALSLDLEAN